MRIRIPILLTALALCSPAIAAAQAPPPDNSDIVVEGMRDRAQRLRNFVRDLTPSSPLTYNQLARWEVPVCPAAFGLTPAQRAFVVDRMRMLAKAADVPLAKPGCDPNVIVIVTSNKSALLAALETETPRLFPGRLERSAHPQARARRRSRHRVAIRGHIIDGWIAHRRRHSFRRYRRPGGAGRGDDAYGRPGKQVETAGPARRAHLDPDRSNERTGRYHDDAVRGLCRDEDVREHRSDEAPGLAFRDDFEGDGCADGKRSAVVADQLGLQLPQGLLRERDGELRERAAQ